MNTLPIAVPQQSIETFCHQHHVQRMALFGSVLRDDFTPNSDIDVLVDFEPGHVPGLIGLNTMQSELETLFKRSVDLLTPKFLHQNIRQGVLNEAYPLYDATSR